MKKALFFLFVLLAPAVVHAQDRQWLPDGRYDSDIPTPREALGYEIGDWLTDHLRMVDYIHRLEKASGRVRVIPIGQSVEKRGMYLVVVTSPAGKSQNPRRREGSLPKWPKGHIGSVDSDGSAQSGGSSVRFDPTVRADD